MDTNFSEVDPYSPTEGYYECIECGHREHRSDSPGRCPNCDGQVQNIAVPRE